MNNLSNNQIKIIDQALFEDIASGDITTQTLIPESASIKVDIIFKQQGILAGIKIAEYIFQKLDSNINFTALKNDGNLINEKETIVNIEGNARDILTAERTALNFLQRLSGIASITHKFVQEVKEFNTKILDTRKTTPTLRKFEKYAVKIAGGKNHRFGLFDQVLIKENHISQIQKNNPDISRPDAIKKAIFDIKKKLGNQYIIEIEVENKQEALSASEAEPDIILFDNMPVEKMTECIELIKNKNVKTPLFEASGNINLSNVKQIAKTGVDRISIGSLTHSYNSVDISLIIK